MAGITHLLAIYKQKGRDFVDKLFDKFVTVNEKLDGCLHPETIIETIDGPMTIKNVVDNCYTGKIVSVNLDDGSIELDAVVAGTSVKDDSAQWYEIETEDNKILIITGNHKIWIPSLNCWRRVDELNGNEDFLTKE